MTLDSLGQTAKQVLATVAPLLGTALGGPFGGLAGTMLSKALGTTDPSKIEAAITSTDPDILLKLKQADNDFKTQTEALQISEEKLSFDDTASARAREMTVKDHTPAILAYFITAGFFAVLGYMMVKGAPATNGGGGEAFLIILGALGAAWTGVISYYFGSSAGSVQKDKTLADIAKS
jgi:hypothetical protein